MLLNTPPFWRTGCWQALGYSCVNERVGNEGRDIRLDVMK